MTKYHYPLINKCGDIFWFFKSMNSCIETVTNKWFDLNAPLPSRMPDMGNRSLNTLLNTPTPRVSRMKHDIIWTKFLFHRSIHTVNQRNSSEQRACSTLQIYSDAVLWIETTRHINMLNLLYEIKTPKIFIQKNENKTLTVLSMVGTLYVNIICEVDMYSRRSHLNTSTKPKTSHGLPSWMCCRALSSAR